MCIRDSVGALKALEELGVLPIDIEKPGQNQIKGISGGSAGAIVALLVAMGIRSTDLIKILAVSYTHLAGRGCCSPQPDFGKSAECTSVTKLGHRGEDAA